ncbi:MAG: NAD-dependent epimerase/dehydratase family protein [Solirubrobacteraceae bacterium]
MRILITGVSGFVGSALARRLARGGHELHGLSRDPAKVDPALELERVHAGDALSGVGLGPALEGVDVAYYLIHSMEATTAQTGFAARDRRAAELFGAAARAAGVARIVYLGGLIPPGAEHSPHLDSRLEVERTLLGAVPGSVALRASIVIGARSRSFRFLVHLVERMPVLALPSWRGNRTQPIDERDVVEYLVAAADAAGVGGCTLDVAGRDTLSYGEMISRIAELMLVDRPSVGLGFQLTSAASVVAARIAGEQVELVGPLMESLDGDLLADDRDARRLLGVRLHSFDASVEHALREWETREPLRAR